VVHRDDVCNLAIHNEDEDEDVTTTRTKTTHKIIVKCRRCRALLGHGQRDLKALAALAASATAGQETMGIGATSVLLLAVHLDKTAVRTRSSVGQVEWLAGDFERRWRDDGRSRFLVYSRDEDRGEWTCMSLVWVFGGSKMWVASSVPALQPLGEANHKQDAGKNGSFQKALRVLYLDYADNSDLVAKVAKDWTRDRGCERIDLSVPIARHLVDHLRNNATSLPVAQREMNGFHASFLYIC